jgi:glycosyltransferase involved in cell wall biosynthesis
VSEAPLVGVVVATRNRSRRLAELLESLRSQTLDPGYVELVVVDDASTDDTPAVLDLARREWGPRLTVIRRASAGGPGAARNDGWRAARAPLIAFTDDDCRADPGWLAAGLKAALANPGSFVQGRTQPISDELAGEGPYSRTLRVDAEGPYYQTCNMFYPRPLLERLDGFRALRSGEDTELAWRAMEAGWSSAWEPGARVEHAVLDRGPLGNLRFALSWSDAMYNLARHPGVRNAVMGGGLFWKPSHRLLALAAVGALLGVRHRPALLMAAPYVVHLTRRRGEPGVALRHLPYLALYDVVETVATVRGAVRHRVPVV